MSVRENHRQDYNFTQPPWPCRCPSAKLMVFQILVSCCTFIYCKKTVKRGRWFRSLRMLKTGDDTEKYKLADTVKIRKKCWFHFAWTFILEIKMFSPTMPCLLTVNQNQHGVDDSETCLKLFLPNWTHFLPLYVTAEESWIHHYTQDPNGQSSE